MSANTTYYVKIPKVSYVWVLASAVTEDEVYRMYPQALEVKHWSAYENED